MGFFYKKQNGFTLAEVLVALSILAILAAVVIASMGEARKKARDAQRVSDLQQVKIATRAYQDLISSTVLPTANPAEVFGDGLGFDTTIAPYLSGTIKDPLNSGSNRYYYHSAYPCGGAPHAVIVAHTMERSSNGNFASVCGAGPYGVLTTGVTPTAASYVILLN